MVPPVTDSDDGPTRLPTVPSVTVPVPALMVRPSMPSIVPRTMAPLAICVSIEVLTLFPARLVAPMTVKEPAV